MKHTMDMGQSVFLSFSGQVLLFAFRERSLCSERVWLSREIRGSGLFPSHRIIRNFQYMLHSDVSFKNDRRFVFFSKLSGLCDGALERIDEARFVWKHLRNAFFFFPIWENNLSSLFSFFYTNLWLPDDAGFFFYYFKKSRLF